MPKVRLVCAFLAYLCASSLAAQNPPDAPSAAQKPEAMGQKVLDLVAPTNLIVEGRDTKVAPLSAGQKFGQVGKNFVNPFTFVGAGIEAGFDQAIDVHHGCGQGAEGYGKRYGADIADIATGEFFGYGVYPSIFHTDPRYYRMGSGSFISRAFYSVTRVLETRTDSGRHVFNAPEILAAATSSGISRAYYPDDERNGGDFVYSMGSRIAFDAAFNFAKEFWPDVRRHLFGGHK